MKNKANIACNIQIHKHLQLPLGSFRHFFKVSAPLTIKRN